MTLTSIVVAGAVLLLLLALLRGRRDSPSIDLDTATEADIPALLMGGHKIDAIKAYRRLHGVDLKAAKEAVERLAAELPPPVGT
jgi:ribosomal protein L7/L12